MEVELVALFPGAGGAFSLDDEGDGAGGVAVGEGKGRKGDVFEAEGLLAGFAVEVDVSVGEVAGAGAGAGFVVKDAAAVLEGVDDVVLEEEGEDAKDGGFVHGEEGVFEVGEGHGPG